MRGSVVDSAEPAAGDSGVGKAHALVHAALSASRAGGPTMFADLVRDLAATLAVDAAFVAVFTDDTGTHLRTLAAVLDGEPLANYSFAVATSPCAGVIGRDFRYVARGVSAEFRPGSLYLAAGIDSYAAHTMTDRAGRTVGLVAVLSRAPIQDQTLSEALLKIYAVRMGAEIERTRAEESLRDAALAVSSARGDAVFAELAGYLAKLLGVETAFVALTDESDPCQMRMLALHVDGQASEGGTYPLRGGPCETVLGREFRVYPDRVQELFPEDDAFRQGGARAYAGFPLFEEDGTPIGVIAIVSRRPLDDAARIEPMMRIFAARAGAEIARIRAADALRASEASYRSIFEATEDPVFVHDWDTGEIVDANPAACAVYGYCLEEARALRLTDLCSDAPPYTAADALQWIERAKRGGVQRFEWHRRNRDGSLHWDEVRLKPAEIGGKRRVLAFTREITQRKLAEEALAASEEQYRAIFNTSGDALVLRDAQFRIVDANPAFFAMHGYRPEDVVGRILPPLLIDEHRPIAQAMLEKAIVGTACAGEFRNRRPDGSLLEIDVRMLPVRFRDQPHVLVVARDVTAAKGELARRRALEAQLLQAQKMEAIGQLTGGIAHDFNNILTSVLGYIALASERAAAIEDPHLGRQLDQAHVAAQRARDLIAKMLAFSRRQRADRRPHQLEPVVHQAISLLRPMLPTTIELQTDVPPSMPAVSIDAVQVEQLLVNLCINARDAIGRAGRIRIAVRRAEVRDAVCASCRDRADGTWVELVVADTGSGVPPDVMERMFDPFYTTKEVGQGSGMGLAMVHGIVHDHGGHVIVHSEPGAGTTFRICLPPAAAPATQQPARVVRPDDAPRPTLRGRVLLVEDQPLVAGFVTELLESWGLSVTLHRHPDEARDWFMRNPQQVDVVITDQTMPSTTGVELAASITSVRPDLPVFVYTGYGEGLGDADLRGAGVHALLKKPIESAVLRGHLERALRPVS
jgi:PAS domain S-box-containing protein